MHAGYEIFVVLGIVLAVWVGTFVLLRINPRDDDDGQQR